MKVILNEYIETLGRVGDIIEVKPGYARNYLLPRKLAVLPTKHNMEVMKYKKVKAEKQLEQEKMSARELKEKLEQVTISIEKKAGESDTLFGSVTTMEIQGKLEELGYTFDRKKIHLDEHIKKLGVHTCRVKLIEEIEAEIKIEVLREGGELEENQAETEVVEDVQPEVAQEEETPQEEVVEEVAETEETPEEETEEADQEEDEQEKPE